MKTLIYSIFSMLILSLCACQNSSAENAQEIAGKIENTQNTLKRYNLKSGIIKYKTDIKGKVMGSTINGSGTEEVYFKDWGAVELKKSDSKQVTHINIFGQKKTEVNEEHTINKLENGKSYGVDMENKIIYVKNDPAMEMIKKFGNGDVVNAGEKMLEGMGGKKIGKEKILGYECDVWEIPGGKQWIYKGIPLKLEMTIMGITTTNTATEAKFNIDVPDKYFKLPDYPVQEIQNPLGDNLNDMPDMNDPETKKELEKMKNMSYDEYKKMVLEDEPGTSEKEIKMGYQLMKAMVKQITK